MLAWWQIPVNGWSPISHPMKLRPYHNPQKADASLIPLGWRMIYADEFPLNQKRRRIPCRLFVWPIYEAGIQPHFSARENCLGIVSDLTYIVPVDA